MILEKIKDILSEQLNINPNDITLKTSLRDDLEADSLDLVSVILAMEEEFGIEVDDDALEELSTVEDAVDYIAEHTGCE